MAGNMFDRFLLLERSGNGRSNTSVFEMRLNGKKLHIRHGNKGQKLAKKIYKKQSISDAITLFSDKRKQKINDGYRIIKEEDRNNGKNCKIEANQSLNAALPISGKSIANMNQNIQTHDDLQRRLKHGNQLRQHRPRKKQQNKLHKIRQKQRNKNKKQHKKHREEEEEEQQEEEEEEEEYTNNDQENKSQTANGNIHHHNGYELEEQYDEESEFNSAMNSESDDEDQNEEETEETEADQREEDGREEEAEAESSSSSSSSSNSSVQSGRSSDNEYEMDYEKMGHVMNAALNKDVNLDELEWKPLKVWIRFNEYHDTNGEYAMPAQVKRIAGSCHELLVVYMRSSSFEHEKNVIYKRLLKLARDPEEDNKHHFDTERNVSQYLSRMALMVNNSFISRSDVCIWPVETVQFEYEGRMKWATIQAPFLPDTTTNNVFVKIEPNSGKPCVYDPLVGRYQHLFASVTRGLDLIRDWQGYGVSQHVFLDVCSKFNVQKQAVTQIKVRKNERIQKQTQVLVVIDPVLTTYNAHFETNNPTDFGIKAIDEWKNHHDCVRCRCKYFHLLSTNICDENEDGMQFGIADIDQHFFNKETIPKHICDDIKKCRYDLNIWCGDDYFDDGDCKDNKDNDNNCRNSHN